MKKIILLLVISINVLGQAKTPICKESSLKQFYLMLSFQKDRIEQTTEDESEWYDFPWYSTGMDQEEDFYKIFHSPTLYYGCYNTLINQKNITNREKHILLFSLQNLELREYLLIVRQTYQAYLKGLVSEHTLRLAFDQEFITNGVIRRNKNHKEVLEIIYKISKDKDVPIGLREHLLKFKQIIWNAKMNKSYQLVAVREGWLRPS